MVDQEDSPGGGDANPLQYHCLQNPKDRGAWQATVHGVTRVRHNRAHKHSHNNLYSPSQNDSTDSSPMMA